MEREVAAAIAADAQRSSTLSDAPPFVTFKYPDVRGASMEHQMMGRDRDGPALLLRHLLQPWTLYPRAFFSRSKAPRWSIGASCEGFGGPPPANFLLGDGRVVCAFFSSGECAFDLESGEDCSAMLMELAKD